MMIGKNEDIHIRYDLTIAKGYEKLRELGHTFGEIIRK